MTVFVYSSSTSARMSFKHDIMQCCTPSSAATVEHDSRQHGLPLMQLPVFLNASMSQVDTASWPARQQGVFEYNQASQNEHN